MTPGVQLTAVLRGFEQPPEQLSASLSGYGKTVVSRSSYAAKEISAAIFSRLQGIVVH